MGLRKKRTCQDCGFVTLGGREAQQADRIALLDGRGPMPGDWETAQCHRGLWTMYDLTYARADLAAIQDELKRSRRDCPGFFRYESGFDPPKHLELQQKVRDQRRQLRITLLTTIFVGGGIVALLIQRLPAAFRLLRSWWPW